MLTTIMIGNKILEARKKKNLSQAQLGEMLSISAQAVGKWERGESMPDIITLNRLAEILGVDLNYFSENFPASTDSGEPAKSSTKETAEPSVVKPEMKSGWDMSCGNWEDADFSGLKNLHDKFSSSNMQRCLFIGSQMSGLTLSSNSVGDCDFSDSDLSNSQFRSSSLTNSIFRNCSLKETSFSSSRMKNCDFSGADLSYATIKNSSFLKNKLSGATLDHTAFSATAFTDIVFDGTLEDCSFQNCSYAKTIFQNATLTNTFFKGRSLKRLRFIDCKMDKITYAFLKSNKADLTGVTLL